MAPCSMLKLLADVYLELLGGRQAALLLDPASAAFDGAGLGAAQKPVLPAREFVIPAEELEAHTAMLARLKTPLWLTE